MFWLLNAVPNLPLEATANKLSLSPFLCQWNLRRRKKREEEEERSPSYWEDWLFALGFFEETVIN